MELIGAFGRFSALRNSKHLPFDLDLRAHRGEVEKANPFSRRAPRPRSANNHDNTTLLDSPPAHKERGRRSAERRMPSTVRATQEVSPLTCARARKRANSGRARLPALRRGTRQTGRSRLTQLQNHVSWNGAEAGVLPASRLSSPAGSPQTGPFAGRVVSRSRPGADWQFRPRAPRPAPPFRHAFRKAIIRGLTDARKSGNIRLS
jgi:hypothetical protein